jgi:16S rRNA (cytosine1402-N4)-methyltransferase
MSSPSLPPPQPELSALPARSSTGDAARHIPVMVEAVVAALAPREDALFIDATFGAGGYSRALIEAAPCRVVGIDRDPEAIRRGHDFAVAYPARFAIVEGNFGDMERLVAAAGLVGPIAGIALDLGVSSLQLDAPERGFSFRFDGPLDMRMSGSGSTAADLVAGLSEQDLARLIHDFGEDRHARRIARTITAARRQRPIRRTSELADLVRAAVPKSEPGLDPATRTFQALRIAVNDELGELERALAAAERLLPGGGRLAVVSFHSLEDRRVKDFLRQRSDAAPHASRHEPMPITPPVPSFRLFHRRPLTPSVDEVRRNPRARSARLRAAERTAAPPLAAEPRRERSAG